MSETDRTEILAIRECFPDVAERGRAINKLRMRVGWSLRELSRRSGISMTVISAFETGKRAPNAENEQRLLAVIRQEQLWQRDQSRIEQVFGGQVPISALANPDNWRTFLKDRAEALRFRSERLQREAEEESNSPKKLELLRRSVQCARQAVADDQEALRGLEE